MEIDKIIFSLTLTTIFLFSILGGLNLLETNWFYTGPSDSLTFFNAKINSIQRYVAVVVFLAIIYSINAIGEFYVESWFTSHVHGLKYQQYCSEYLFRMTACWRVYKMTMFLIQIHIAMSQFDLWLIALLFDIIAYTVLTQKEEHDDTSFTDEEIKKLKKMVLQHRFY